MGGPPSSSLDVAPGSSSTNPPVVVPALPSKDLRPGVGLVVEQGTRACTAGFVLRDGAGGRTFLATAGHCFLDAATCATPLPGLAGAQANATAALPEGPRPIGRFAYVSFLAMQASGVTDPYECYYGDFALIEVDAALAPRVSPVPLVGAAPTALRATPLADGESVTVISALQGSGVAKAGRIVANADPNPAARQVYATATVECGPGDSGAPVLDAQGKAVGIVLTQPGPRQCGIGPLAALLARAEATLGVKLVLATA